MTRNNARRARGRRSIRLPGCDYTQPGAYFISICTYRQDFLFGEVVEGKMVLNEYGQAVEEERYATAQLRPYVELDAHVIMPNHFHGILWTVDEGRGTVHCAPTWERFGKPVSGSLPTIVRAFKSAVTRRINQIRGTPGAPIWQRNYFGHIVRNERALDAIRRYIQNNPARWGLDRYNPDAFGPDPEAKALWNLLKTGEIPREE
jgi:putative transposase